MERMGDQDKNQLLLEMIQHSLETHQSVIAQDESKLGTLLNIIDWSLQANKEDLKTIYLILKRADKKISNHFHQKDLSEMETRRNNLI
jgi:hypothetical protein